METNDETDNDDGKKPKESYVTPPLLGVTRVEIFLHDPHFRQQIQ
jgi:hypothetical protein